MLLHAIYTEFNELDDPLPQNDAYGHSMMIAGLCPEQYFWCDVCAAYFGMRAQILMKPCKHRMQRSQAIERLRLARHPHRDTAIRGWDGCVSSSHNAALR